MGFGILFLGYLVTYIGSMTPIYAYTQLFGILIMLYALSRLYRHNHNFRITFWMGIVYLLQSVMTFVFSFLPILEGSVMHLLEKFSGIGIVLLFHLFLLLSIKEIAEFTSIPKLRTRAIRNIITTFVYYLLTVILQTGWITSVTVLQYTSIASVILGILWIVLNAALIFSCYMWICLEGDEGMEKSPINIPFLNSLNDWMNRGTDKMRAKREEKNREFLERQKTKRKK